jgi:lysophospholipase L1-like esterase
MSEFVRIVQERMERTPAKGRKLWLRRAVFVLLLFLVPLMAAEVALRMAGYSRAQIPLDVQSDANKAGAAALNRRFATDAFVPHRYLLWIHKPGANVAGQTVSDQGTLGPPPARERKPGTLRVLVLGDSVTGAAFRAYPDIAQRLTESARTTRTVEIINGAVAGYSTEQGLRRLRRLWRLKPDIVVACFGWNDHFPALNLPDKELGARNSMAAWAHRLLGGMRLYQLAAAPSDERWHFERQTTGSLRVAPEEFTRNLRRFAETVRAQGAVPVLATQPENLSPESLGHLAGEGFGGGGNEQARLHRDYNRRVRAAAAELKAPLLDLEESFELRNRAVLFEPDGMHLSGAGQNLAARLLISALRNEGYMAPDEFERVVRTARYDTQAPDKPFAAWTLAQPTVTVPTTGTVEVGVLAKNTGNTVWLKDRRVAQMGIARDVPLGGVAVTARWRTADAPTTGTAAESRLAHDLFPGESTSHTLTFAAPSSPGGHKVEIGLRADGVGDLSLYGAEVTTLTVVATPQ